MINMKWGLRGCLPGQVSQESSKCRVNTQARFMVALVLLLKLCPVCNAQDIQNGTSLCASMEYNATGANRMDVWPNNTKDCLVHSRVSQRPFPGDCYSHEYDDWREDDWYKFLNEIMGDFRYTFDFILYDVKYPNAKHTQFWYLINYLKQLAIFIENPQEIIEAMKTLRALTVKIDNMEKEIVRKIVRALIQI